jgi:hypothetical protein
MSLVVNIVLSFMAGSSISTRCVLMAWSRAYSGRRIQDDHRPARRMTVCSHEQDH